MNSVSTHGRSLHEIRLRLAGRNDVMTGAGTRTATLLIAVAVTVLASSAAQAASGELDPTFSGDGKVVTDFGGGDSGAAAAVQPDGKIVVVGTAARDVALARYNADGSLDSSFDGDGKATIDFGGDDHGADVAVQPNGKIVVVGGTVAGFALARYNADGSLDSSFDGDGKLATDFGGSGGAAYGVALQLDGKIVAVGQGGAGFAVARYNPDGSLDTSFDGDGKQTTEFASGAAAAVALQSDGKIVAVGRALGDGMDFALARYNADGSLDSTFDGDGKQITAIPFNSDEWLSDVAIQPDGWLVVVGTDSEPNICGCTDLVVGQYTPDGSPAGLPLTSVSGTDSGAGVALQPDGKIVAAGSALSDGQGDFLLARYSAIGSPDATFAAGGMQTTDFGGSDAAGGVALQSDGKIVVAGSAAGDFALGRYEGGSISGTAPLNTTLPTISGTAAEGQALMVSPGTWTGSTPITRDYRWRRCDPAGANCLDIAAAAATTYTLVAADVGQTIRVRETATNAYGQTSVASAATAVVTATPTPGGIVGTVRNTKTGAVITNAAVDCGSGYSTTTAGGGKYSIPKVPSGGYACTASASGYRSSTQSVTVSASQTTTANFSLARQ
jgi:uncharacterized delta-60 repeat protein